MPLLSLLPLFGISLTLQRRFELGAAFALMLAVAGWVAFVIRQAQAGIPLDDPMHAALAEAAQASGDPATALLALIYDAPLPAHFVESVSAQAAALGAQARGSDAQGSQLS